MHIDLQETPDLAVRLDADVAIIGAGAAGLTACRRLLAAGLEVVLLESGGVDFEADVAELNRGENVGQPYYELDHARLRFFGGTTAIWGGRCAELDPIDLERRPWVPNSGWPIDFADLRRYYAEAWRSVDLADRADPPRNRGLSPFRPDEIRAHFWRFDERADRFSFDRCRDLRAHPGCTIVTHATVREIVAREGGRAVASLDVRAPNGRRLSVHAGNYLLAAGGIENPRLLLASRSVVPVGLGNDHDMVGRCFMEHPHARGGRIVKASAWKLLDYFRPRHRASGRLSALLAAAPDLQQREGLLNSSVTVAARRPADGSAALLLRAYHHVRHHADPTRAGRMAWRSVKHLVQGVQRLTDPLRPWLLHKLGRVELALVVRAEQAPNPDSRVLLAEEPDALGMPRVKLDWRTTPLDVHSVERLVAAVGREFGRLGIGEVQPAAWLSDRSGQWVTDPLVSAHPIGGYHHMGTTRMSENPHDGVTDASGRVHGIDNLYVAGSSLFPTGGWANPTLTIIALAMRTADAIAGKTANQRAARWPAGRDRDRMRRDSRAHEASRYPPASGAAIRPSSAKA